MNLYAVFKEAVYSHGCGGIFDDYDLAVAAAVKLAQGDRDNHHEYVVRPYNLNEVTPQVSCANFRKDVGDLIEPDIIFARNKKTASAAEGAEQQ